MKLVMERNVELEELYGIGDAGARDSSLSSYCKLSRDAELFC